MRVHLRLAEPFWRAFGQRDVDLDLEPGSRVDDLLTLLKARYPALGGELEAAQPHIFVGEAEATPETALSESDQVHLIWPVAGG